MNKPEHSRLDDVLRMKPAASKARKRGEGAGLNDLDDLSIIEDLLIGSDFNFSAGADDDWALPEFLGEEFEAPPGGYVDTDELRAARNAVLADSPPIGRNADEPAQARPDVGYRHASLDDILDPVEATRDAAPPPTPDADAPGDHSPQDAPGETFAADRSGDAAPEPHADADRQKAARHEGFVRGLLRRTGVLRERSAGKAS